MNSIVMRVLGMVFILLCLFLPATIWGTGHKINPSVDFFYLNKCIHDNEKALSQGNKEKLNALFTQYSEYYSTQKLAYVATVIHTVFTARYLEQKYTEKNPKKQAEIERRYEEAVRILTEHQFKSLEVWCKIHFANYYYTQLRYDLAFPLFLSVDNELKKLDSQIILSPAETYMKLGYFMGYMRDYDNALLYLEKALNYDKNNLSLQARLHDNIGLYQLKQEKYNEAEKTLKIALDLSEKAKDTSRIARVYGNLGELAFLRNQPQEGISYLKRDISLSYQIEDGRNSVYALLMLGNYYSTISQLESIDSIILQLDEIRSVKPMYFEAFEYDLLELYLQHAILHNDTASELKIRRELEQVYLRIKNTDSEESINRMGWQLEKEEFNNKLEVQQGKLKISRNRLIYLSIIGSLIIFIIVLWFILSRRRYKSREMRYHNLILELRLKKQNLENQFYDTKNSFETLLRNRESQLIELQKQIKDFQKRDSELDKRHTDQLNELLNSHLITDTNWELFKKAFQARYPQFYHHLTTNYLQLTDSNLRYLILFRLGMSNNEVSTLLGVSPDSVRKAKSRLQEKMADQFEEIMQMNLI